MIVRSKQVRKEAVFNLSEITTKQRNTPAGPRKIITRTKKTPSNVLNKSEFLVPTRACTTDQGVKKCQKGFKKSEEAVKDVLESDTDSLDSGSDEEPAPKKKAPVSLSQRKRLAAERANVKIVVSKCDKKLSQSNMPKQQKSKVPRKQLFTSPPLSPESCSSTDYTAIPSPEVVSSATNEPISEMISDSYRIGKDFVGV